MTRGAWGGQRLAACALAWIAGMTACSTASEPSAEETPRRSEDAPVEAARSETGATARPVQELRLQPIDDYGSVQGDDGRIVVGWAAPQVEVGFFSGPGEHPAPAVLRFDPIASPAECITSATLDVTLDEAPTAMHLAAYPGDPSSVADVDSDGDVVPHWQLLLDNRPRGEFTMVGETPIMTADVTELVQTWARGGPFPSRGLAVDPAAPLVLVVQPETMASPATVYVSMTESGPTTAPTLTVSTTC